LNQIKEESSEEAASNLDWFVSLSDTLSSEHKKLEMREALDSSRGLPSARVAWERQDRENRLIAKYAARIKEAVVAGRLFYSDILQLLESNQKLVLSAALRGGGETLESLAVKDLEAAQQTARSFLEKIWSERIVETLDDELESVLVRLTNLGVITEADLFGFGFVLPKLDAEFSGDSSVANELQKFAPAVKRLADKEEWFYPIVIFFGSRLKRYAERKADLDAAVFIKPGIAKTERPRIQNVLRKIFSDKKIQGKVVEFWLEENREGLQVRDFENPDTLLAGSIWTHLLLSGVWLGKSYALKELHTKLLSGLLRPTKMTFMNRPLRIVRLSEMEREVLQYRLMHKGYRRFFAPAGGVNLKTQGPDPQSVFWDSGYRRLATKLFVSRVFMPELDQ
jgi:predicted nucleotidyltransferase